MATKASSSVIQSISASQILPGAATAGQVLTYNGSTSTWVASAAPGSAAPANSYAITTTTTILTAPGTSTWTCPANVNRVAITLIGGGGGCGLNAGPNNYGVGGGGGGAGGTAYYAINVSPGSTYSYTIAASSAPASNGNTTSCSIGGVTVTATGGVKGNNTYQSYIYWYSGSGGAGGSVAAVSANTVLGFTGVTSAAGGAGGSVASSYCCTTEVDPTITTGVYKISYGGYAFGGKGGYMGGYSPQKASAATCGSALIYMANNNSFYQLKNSPSLLMSIYGLSAGMGGQRGIDFNPGTGGNSGAIFIEYLN